MKTELFIEGMQVDITADLPALLTLAIDDIKDKGDNPDNPKFGSRNTSFSKTIVVPGTARNNKLFGHIYEIGSGNPYDSALPNINTNFNAAKSASALMFQENIQAFKGIVRLLKIIKYKGTIEYEVALFGELGSFIAKMGNSKIEDLDFSAYDLAYSAGNIESSWDNPGGSGVFFPLIDYGAYSTGKHDWKYGTFRPALYAKEYIDKIFAAANFTYDCSLFNTTRFKSLVIPQNMKQLVKNVDRQFDVFSTSPTVFTQADGYSNLKLIFSGNTTLGNFTANFFNNDFTYTATQTYTGTAYLKLTGSYTKTTTGSALTFRVLLNGILFTGPSSASIGSGQTSGTFDILISGPINIIASDVLTAALFFSPTENYNVSVDTANLYLSNGSIASVPISLGETIPINDSIPKNILQRDFFSSIVKLWNLYVVEDKFTSNKLVITPYIDFFNTDPATAEDWSYKVDRSQAIEETPMGELNAKLFYYSYKKDSDYYNDLYSKRYNENYGDYIYNSGFEFANDESKLELIFSGTPIVGYIGEDKIYSTIFKQSGTTEENIDSNIRLLQVKKVTGVTSWDLLDEDGTTVLGSYTNYPYCGSLDDPDAPNADLNFGAPRELFFTLVSGNLSNNQFNLYHSGYMSEITDKDSKLLKCSCYLTPMDIYNLDYSKFKYIDGSLFVLNKIEDYDLLAPQVCKVEFLKRINTVF